MYIIGNVDEVYCPLFCILISIITNLNYYEEIYLVINSFCCHNIYVSTDNNYIKKRSKWDKVYKL